MTAPVRGADIELHESGCERDGDLRIGLHPRLAAIKPGHLDNVGWSESWLKGGLTLVIIHDAEILVRSVTSRIGRDAAE
jgi:hypothetical protein